METPFTNQAKRIISKFGGPTELSNALRAVGVARHRTQIYRWQQAKSRNGTGGMIPSTLLPKVLEAARLFGIVITKEDLYGDLTHG